VLSVQRSAAIKLSEYLHQNGEAGTRPKSTSLLQILKDKTESEVLYPQNINDPFVNAQLRCMADNSSKRVSSKKVGRLYDELNM
jgi:hypothetical protein